MTTLCSLIIGLETLQSYDINAPISAHDDVIKIQVKIETLREEDRKLLADKGWFTEGEDLFCHKTN